MSESFAKNNLKYDCVIAGVRVCVCASMTVCELRCRETTHVHLSVNA